MAKPMGTFDLRGDSEAKGYEYFYGPMREKYYGKKVYLAVPFSRKDEAKGLGAEWDSAVKKWFAFANSPKLRGIEEYFKREDS